MRQLQNAGIAVLWRPYPHANGAKFSCIDTLAVEGSARFRHDAELARFAVGKPVGVEFTLRQPPPDFFDQQKARSWFRAPAK